MGLRTFLAKLMVCCVAFWVVASASSGAEETPPPAVCGSLLMLSPEVSTISYGHSDVHTRSLSPWRWRSSTVKDRVPSTLWEAECLDIFCSLPEKQDLMSVPIHQSVLVLTRQQGAHCYTASYRSVAVGCTCVLAKTRQTQGTRSRGGA